MLYRVHAKRAAGFRRAGRFWTAAPVLVDLDEATAAILRAEPMLDVREARPEDVREDQPPATKASVESLEAKIAELAADLASARASGKSDADALIESMSRIETLEASLAASEAKAKDLAATLATTERAHSAAEKALAAAQEACAKLRDENKALKSKKKDAPAPEAAPSEETEAKPS